MQEPGGQYVRPEKLRLPERPPKLVYLDLNWWIGLSKCHSGHPQGSRYAEALNACLDAAAAGRAVFPFSELIFMEITNIGQHRQRRNLREVLEAVSGFRVVTSRTIIMELELDSMLNEHLGHYDSGFNEVDYLDWGVMRALGKDGTPRIVDENGNEVTAGTGDASALGFGSVDYATFQANAELVLNRMVLDGPSPEEEAAMANLGWQPRPTRYSVEQNAAFEQELVEMLDVDPYWRAERLRDVVTAREFRLNYNSMLWTQLNARGVTLNEAFPTVDVSRESFDSMPSCDVAVTLKTCYHQNPQHRWKRNDLYDVDAMAQVVPYCDVVATDKAACSHIKRSGLAERLGTTVIANFDELPALLE